MAVQPAGAPLVATPDPLRARQATSTSPAAVPAGLAMVTTLVAVLLTTLALEARAIGPVGGGSVAVAVGVGVGVGATAVVNDQLTVVPRGLPAMSVMLSTSVAV